MTTTTEKTSVKNSDAGVSGVSLSIYGPFEVRDFNRFSGSVGYASIENKSSPTSQYQSDHSFSPCGRESSAPLSSKFRGKCLCHNRGFMFGAFLPLASRQRLTLLTESADTRCGRCSKSAVASLLSTLKNNRNC